MGHRAPYQAVVALCVTTAESWRTLRPRIPGDPMALTSLHVLLDHAEVAILEGKSGEAEQAAYYTTMYGPETPMLSRQRKPAEPGKPGSGQNRRRHETGPPPPGFEAAAVAADFAAAARGAAR